MASIKKRPDGRYRARYTLRRTGSGWVVVNQKPLGGC